MKNNPASFLHVIVYFIATVITGIVLLQSNIYTQNNRILGSTYINPVVAYEEKSTQEGSAMLKHLVESILADKKGTYGIDIVNLKTGERYSYKEHHMFQSASLYKLWVMEETVNAIQHAKLKGSDVLRRDISELNKKFNIASEAAELKDGFVAMTVDQALDKMITFSDNYAALLLTERVGTANVAKFLKTNSFHESTFGQPPLTSAYDITKFFLRLYYGELSDKENTDRMITLLRRQRLNHKLPKYLPENAVIAHKTGELDRVTHDAGIVFSERGDYIISILTESSSPKEAEDVIAQISASVFTYFTGR